MTMLAYKPRRWRIWLCFPVWVRIQVPSRRWSDGRTEAYDCPIWKAPFIWLREWRMARR